MPTDTEIYDVIIGALEWVCEFGWVQFLEYDEDDQSVDLRGALVVGTYGHYPAGAERARWENDSRERLYFHAYKAVKEHLPGPVIQQLAEYNDAHGRTQDDIEEVLLAAAGTLARRIDKKLEITS